MTKSEIIDYLYDIHAHADYSIEDIADDLAVPVRHGRWIQVSQDRANCNRCNCESGKMIKQGERYFPKFCPECGADMRKDGGNE